MYMYVYIYIYIYIHICIYIYMCIYIVGNDRNGISEEYNEMHLYQI